MPITPSLCRSDPLNKLPISARKHLSVLLDRGQSWRELASRITRRGSDQPMFDTAHIMALSDRYERGAHGSPTEEILRSWGTMQPLLDNVIKTLQECQFTDCADYIRQLVGENPEHTPGPDSRGPALPNPSCGLPADVEQPGDNRTEHDLIATGIHLNYMDLKHWTNDFDERPLRQGGRLVGAGGFGMVFLGICEGKADMAIKRLVKANNAQFTSVGRQFIIEVAVLSRVKHDNVVPLIGYSQDGEFQCIVYKYMVNGSLQDRLLCKDNSLPLSAEQRVHIAQGVARGIHYLHTCGEVALVHRDIKSANILLDSDFTAKLGDCGLAHFGPEQPDKDSHTLTQLIVGSKAYMAIEYILEGEVSIKTDAFAYGIVLLELLTALPAMDSHRIDAALGAHIKQNVNDIHTVIDKSAGPWSHANIQSIFNLSCQLQKYKGERPTITQSLEEINRWDSKG